MRLVCTCGSMINLFKRLASTETFRTRARAVEAVGFVILLVGLFHVWQPLGWLVLGAALVAYAQLVRR